MRAYKYLCKSLLDRYIIIFWSLYFVVCMIALSVCFDKTGSDFWSALLPAILLPTVGIIVQLMMFSNGLKFYIQRRDDINGNPGIFKIYSLALLYYMIESGEMNGIDFLDWSKEYCEGKYILGRKHVFFQKETDATLFRLTVL